MAWRDKIQEGVRRAVAARRPAHHERQAAIKESRAPSTPAHAEDIEFDKLEQLQKTMAHLLPGEELYAVYDMKGGGTGFVGVTDQRLIFQDPSLLGTSTAVVSIPHSRITAIAAEDSGKKVFRTSTLTVCAGTQTYEFHFRAHEKAHRAYQLILQQQSGAAGGKPLYPSVLGMAEGFWKRFWKRRGKLGKAGIIVGVFIIAGLLIPTGDKDPAPTTTTQKVAAVASTVSATTTTILATTTTHATTTSSVTTTSTVLLATVYAQVTEVVDGDTIRADYGGVSESIRLIGIDTPERGEPFSTEATDALAALVGGKAVELEFDVTQRDQYERLLAYVWVGSIMANTEMLRAGLATLYTVPPNVEHTSAFQAAQDEAQAAQQGIWGASAGPPIQIGSIHYNAAGNDHDNKNDEYIIFEVLVAGSLVGYSVEDDAGHKYAFPDRVFQSDQLFTLHTGSGTDSQSHLYWGSGSAIWNNDGDTVKVLDPEGHVVVSKSY